MVWDPARVTPRSWENVVDFFRSLAERNDDFRPMLRLVEHLASQGYAASLFAATSGTALLVAREADGDWTLGALRVDVSLSGSVRLTLPQATSRQPTTFECEGKAIIQAFERFLPVVRRLQWPGV
jgi:hypothetical protein